MEETYKSEDRGFMKEAGDYIMIIRRGGNITDIWKLESAEIKYNERTHGWIVFSQNNPTFFVSADVEFWSIKNRESVMWLKYKEYHQLDAPATRETFIDAEKEKLAAKNKKFFRWPVAVQNPLKWNW